ncbi:hypothetical protein, partial [Actinomadura rubrisoli]|uniref:hypothetical protein n=1 Tax=Actinomadura rubrisoli TaxID=2530368 RepID=UPI001A9FAF8F
APRPPRRRRTALIIAVTAAVLAALVAGGIIALALAGKDDDAAPGQKRSDAWAVRACRDAHKATHGGGDSEKAVSARKNARQSSVYQLAAIGLAYDDATQGTALDDIRAMRAARAIDTWCANNKVGQ